METPQAPALRQDSIMNDETRAALRRDVERLQRFSEAAQGYHGRLEIIHPGGVVSLVNEFAGLCAQALEQDVSPVMEANLTKIDPGRAQYVGEKVRQAFGGFCIRSSSEAAREFFAELGLKVIPGFVLEVPQEMVEHAALHGGVSRADARRVLESVFLAPEAKRT